MQDIPLPYDLNGNMSISLVLMSSHPSRSAFLPCCLPLFVQALESIPDVMAIVTESGAFDLFVGHILALEDD